MEPYLLSFIIGASWPVFILFFVAVSKYGPVAKYDYKTYTLIAPLFLGLLNMFGLYIARMFGLTHVQRFLYTALIGAAMISILITYFELYNFDSQSKWNQQYLYLFITYIFVFSIIVYGIEELLKCAN